MTNVLVVPHAALLPVDMCERGTSLAVKLGMFTCQIWMLFFFFKCILILCKFFIVSSQASSQRTCQLSNLLTVEKLQLWGKLLPQSRGGDQLSQDLVRGWRNDWQSDCCGVCTDAHIIVARNWAGRQSSLFTVQSTFQLASVLPSSCLATVRMISGIQMTETSFLHSGWAQT